MITFGLLNNYLQRGPSGHGHDRNVFLLRRAQQFSDLVRLVVIMENYMFGFSFSYRSLHTSGGRRFLGLPNDLLIILLV